MASSNDNRLPARTARKREDRPIQQHAHTAADGGGAEESLKPLSTRIPAELHKQLRFTAFDNNTSVQQEVINALRKHLS